MGLLDKLTGRDKKATGVALTDTGLEKVEQLSGNETQLRYGIMVYLQEHQSSSIRQVANGLNTDEGKVRKVAEILIREGYLRKATLEE